MEAKHHMGLSSSLSLARSLGASKTQNSANHAVEGGNPKVGGVEEGKGGKMPGLWGLCPAWELAGLS